MLRRERKGVHMAQYMIINSHTPEECEGMESDVDKLPPALKGADFYCTLSLRRTRLLHVPRGRLQRPGPGVAAAQPPERRKDSGRPVRDLAAVAPERPGGAGRALRIGAHVLLNSVRHPDVRLGRFAASSHRDADPRRRKRGGGRWPSS